MSKVILENVYGDHGIIGKIPAESIKVIHTIKDTLRVVEESIENWDLDTGMEEVTKHLRWVADIKYTCNSWLKQEVIDLEVRYGQLELSTRDSLEKKITKDEVKAYIYGAHPWYVERLQKMAEVESFIEHLDALKQILFARKDLFLERSIDRRSIRKEDKEAL